VNGLINVFASAWMNDGPNGIRVQRRDVIPEEQLNQDGRAAEEPDVERAGRGHQPVGRQAHDCQQDAQRDADRHRDRRQLDRHAQTAEDARVEQVIADDTPLEVRVGGDRAYDRDRHDEHDGRRHPAPRTPDRDGRDVLGSPGLFWHRAPRGHLPTAHSTAPLIFGEVIAPSWTPHFLSICRYVPFAISAFIAPSTAVVIPVFFGTAKP